MTDRSLRFSRQAACWEKFEDSNTNKMTQIEEKIMKKEKKYDSWVKEMRRNDKDRQLEIKVNQANFEARRKAIQDKIVEQEAEAVESY